MANQSIYKAFERMWMHVKAYVDDSKGNIIEIEESVTEYPTFVQGTLTGGGVTETASTTRIRTDFLPTEGRPHVSIASGYKWCVFVYNHDKTLYKEYGWRTTSNIPVLQDNAEYVENPEDYPYYRLIMAKNDDSSISVSEGKNLYVERTLTKEVTTSEVVNLNDFATGDGVTDDSDNIQRALDLARGKTLFVPSGDYIVSKTLYIHSDTKIIGNGVDSHFVLSDSYSLDEVNWRYGTELAYPVFITDKDSKNIILKDFRFTGSKATIRDIRLWGICVYYAENVLCENLYLDYFNYNGNLATSNVGQPAYSLFVFHSKNVTISGGKYEYGGYENIGGEYCENILVENVYCGTAWRVPMQFHQGSKNIKIINNTIESVDCAYTHSLLTFHGQTVNGYSDYVTDVLVFGNYFKGVTANIINRGGIQTVQGNEANIKIIGNTFECNNECIHNASDQQQGENGNNDWIIKENKFIGKKGVTLTAQNVICKDNIFDTTEQAIKITASNKIVSDNLFLNNSTVS